MQNQRITDTIFGSSLSGSLIYSYTMLYQSSEAPSGNVRAVFTGRMPNQQRQSTDDAKKNVFVAFHSSFVMVITALTFQPQLPPTQ